IVNDYQSLSHTRGECKSHVVFIPQGRRKALDGQLRAAWGEGFRELARPKESKVEEGQLRPDHVHLWLAIPPKYAVAHVGGLSRGSVPATLPAPLAARGAPLAGNSFGPGGTLSRPSAATRRCCGSTVSTKKRRTSAWSSERFSRRNRSPLGGLMT